MRTLIHTVSGVAALALAVPWASTAFAAPASSAYTIRPNPDEAVLIAAASQPADTATHPDRSLAVGPNPDEVGSGPRALSSTEFARLTGPPPRAGHAQTESGFAWGDAGIGAGVMFVLAVIGVGAALVLSGRRQREATSA